MDSIKKLVIFGCSFSYGSELYSEEDVDNEKTKNLAYGKFLSEKLNCEYINNALPGASNFEISRRVVNYLLKDNNKNNSLYIIGWTDHNRFSFIPNKGLSILDSKFTFSEPLSFSSYAVTKHEYNSSNKNFNISSYLLKLANMEIFASFFNKYIFNSGYYYELNYINRINISSLLEQHKVKYLTFPSLPLDYFYMKHKYENFLNKNNNLLEDNFNFFNEYKHYGIHKGGHIKKEGHIDFAKFLYKKLISDGIVSS